MAASRSLEDENVLSVVDLTTNWCNCWMLHASFSESLSWWFVWRSLAWPSIWQISTTVHITPPWWWCITIFDSNTISTAVISGYMYSFLLITGFSKFFRGVIPNHAAKVRIIFCNPVAKRVHFTEITWIRPILAYSWDLFCSCSCSSRCRNFITANATRARTMMSTIIIFSIILLFYPSVNINTCIVMMRRNMAKGYTVA